MFDGHDPLTEAERPAVKSTIKQKLQQAKRSHTFVSIYTAARLANTVDMLQGAIDAAKRELAEEKRVTTQLRGKMERLERELTEAQAWKQEEAPRSSPDPDPVEEGSVAPAADRVADPR